VWKALVEPLAWSGLWVALAAGALAAAASGAMGLGPASEVVALVAAGTFVVYAVDRLRDVARDRETAPRRTAFVERHARALAAAAAVAGAAAVALALRVGPSAPLVLAPVAALGFGHRRVKHLAFAKSAYLTLAWVCVVVLFPALALGGAHHVAWAALAIGAALQANAIASNVRDREGAVARIGTGPALRLAHGAVVLGIGVALAGPAPVRPLACVPAATGLALLRFRADETYGLVVVDGALLAGGLAALALAALYPG
jgi:hypothetical protein